MAFNQGAYSCSQSPKNFKVLPTIKFADERRGWIWRDFKYRNKIFLSRTCITQLSNFLNAERILRHFWQGMSSNTLANHACNIVQIKLYIRKYTVLRSHRMYCTLDLRMNDELVTAGADAPVYIRLLGTYTSFLGQKPYTIHIHIYSYIQYTVASAQAVTGWVFMRRFRLFLGQCNFCSFSFSSCQLC